MRYTPLDQFDPLQHDPTTQRLGPNLQWANNTIRYREKIKYLLSSKKISPADLELILRSVTWRDDCKFE